MSENNNFTVIYINNLRFTIFSIKLQVKKIIQINFFSLIFLTHALAVLYKKQKIFDT